MKLKRSHKIVLLLIGLVLFVVWVECEQRFVVKGRVVDASTGKPIEGASVAIRWIGYSFPAFYSSGGYLIEAFSVTTDKQGQFEIPKYFFKDCYLSVYKKGYVCWHNKRIFLKGINIEREDRVVDRNWYWVKNGMIVQLEQLTDEYPRSEHASFVNAVSSISGGLKGTGEEINLYIKNKWDK